MTVTPKKHSAQPASSYYYKSPRSSPAQMDDVEGLRLKLPSEDPVPLSSALAEPISLEDSHYVGLRVELEVDSQGLEAESWSTAVDQNYMKGLNKEDAKRQDVIYELMQTEMHHVRTLKILLCVYMHELRKSQLMDEAKLERLFPGVEALLGLHQHFLNCLKERLMQCQQEGSPNYQITKLGDILISQFSHTLGESMMQSYSLFCSHQNDAISFYKEMLQSSKKFQILIKQKIGQLPLVRRLGIPECFLLVTQRITKYPILVERIIENTEAETGEYQSLIQGLALIKDTITKVNDQVSEYEKVVRLSQRLEPKSLGRLKDGQLLRREDLIQGNRVLLHRGFVSWKSSGRQKDVNIVLLSDMLLLLQEKDQKLVFAAVDNKPPVIPLQRLIVREVANEDKAMFLISAYISNMPEMYEIHTSSREECITWMTFIRGAVISAPEDDGYHDLINKLQQFQDILKLRDEQIKRSLTEKQKIFAALYETVMEQEAPHKGLLLRGVPTDLHQGETLLNRAIEEMEILQTLLFIRIKHPNLMDENDMEEGLLKQAETFVGADSDSSANTMKGLNSLVQGLSAAPLSVSHTTRDPQPPEIDYSEELEQSADDDIFPTPTCHPSSSHFPGVCDSVMKLVHLLYSLKTLIAQQDSQIELHRALHLKTQQPSRHYSNVLLEQEKQRNLEKQREDLANLHKLQVLHQEEQQRWETERDQQRLQIETLGAQLQQREQDCRKLEEKLMEEKAELERQKDEHQQSLESLRDAVKLVEKREERLTQERERLNKAQEKIHTKYMSMRNAGHSHYDEPTQFSTKSSVVNGSGSLVFALKPQLSSNTTSDITEIPPKVPPRKESILNHQTKSERPVRPISTKSQVQNPSGVQQQIPAKLAAPPKGKDRGLKTKKSHQRTHSAASIDVNQVLPIRVTGKEGGSLRSTRNPSPHRIYGSDLFVPPGSLQSMKTSQSFSTHKRNISSSESSPPVPPPFPKDVPKMGKEKSFFVLPQ
ncbi:rho guanine nucleotide exchange factor 18a isoform X2 [Channa argus]|uniref:rho guanine nucleotide exchange factor 18a isoform X2 n=1 Tax=Channa argus TaxID=215402 RepID=UPI003521983A